MESTEALNVDSIIARLHCAKATAPERAPVVSEREMRTLCQKCSELLLSEPALLQVEPPVTICGDIHGQFVDLLRWFNCNGRPGRTNYLFLGDYVDRGSQSLEVFSLLMAYRIKFPECFKLLRGNHECANMNRKYGFYDECCKRASLTLWKCFTDTFDCLPAAAIVGDSIFCSHGGISPHLRNLNQICRIRRPTPVPHRGLLCDLLWTDPLRNSMGWKKNEARGVSYTYGEDVVGEFLRNHDMDLVCRAHQVVRGGYEFFADRKLVTIFSAPNYCGRFNNSAAVMLVDEDLTCSFRTLRPGPTKPACLTRVSSSTTVYDVS